MLFYNFTNREGAHMRNKSWPFKNLDVGQSCTIPAQDAAKARAYAYVYGNQRGKKFSCKAQPDGSLVVTRRGDEAKGELILTLEEFEALAKHFSKDRLREIAQAVSGPFRVEHRGDHAAILYNAN